jgi:hypothetical protein
MPTELDHIALANRNHTTLAALVKFDDIENHAEWITTIAFYKALHVVEAVFAHSFHEHGTGHEDRLFRLKAVDENLHKHYRALWSASTIARYLYDHGEGTAYRTFSDFIPPGNVFDAVVLGRLRPIEELAVSRLSERGRTELKRIRSA